MGSPALYRDPAGIPAKRPVRADDPVARDDHRDRVAAVRPADRTGRAGTPDPPRDLRVARRLAVRDRAHLVPHGALERGALDIEVEVEVELGPRSEERRVGKE